MSRQPPEHNSINTIQDGDIKTLHSKPTTEDHCSTSARKVQIVFLFINLHYYQSLHLNESVANNRKMSDEMLPHQEYSWFSQ